MVVTVSSVVISGGAVGRDGLISATLRVADNAKTRLTAKLPYCLKRPVKTGFVKMLLCL